MPDFLLFLFGLYLVLTCPPVVVAWRRGLPAPVICRTAFWGVLLGWTVFGALWAWMIALQAEPITHVTVRVSVKVDRN